MPATVLLSLPVWRPPLALFVHFPQGMKLKFCVVDHVRYISSLSMLLPTGIEDGWLTECQPPPTCGWGMNVITVGREWVMGKGDFSSRRHVFTYLLSSSAGNLEVWIT